MIRTIEPGDLAPVIDLIREFAAFEGLSEYCETTEERLTAALFGDGSVVEGLVAIDGDRVVGYALFFPNFSSFRGQRGLFLDDIFVTAEYRSRGIGIALLRRVACIANERNFERIDLLVQRNNLSAIDFYKKLGAEANLDERHFKFSGHAFRNLAE